MIFELYIVVVFVAAATLLYGIFYRDTQNFTHIVSEFLSAVLFIILGYVAYDGIQFQHVVETGTFVNGTLTAITESVTLTTYQYGWLGGLLIVIGVIAALHAIVQVFNENADMIKETEGDYKYDPNETVK